MNSPNSNEKFNYEMQAVGSQTQRFSATQRDSNNNLLKQLTSNKGNQSQRRLIIGFEANKNINGNFLRKLDRMISVSSRPKSRVSQHVEDVKYAPGEGIKQMAKAVTALNNMKYSEVKPSSSTLAIDNNVL